MHNLLTQINLCHPVASDGSAISACVHDCPPLEPNSVYAYVLFCNDFAESCVVARDAAGVVGFVIGYPPPPRRNTVFVWQIGVHPRARGHGLGRRMLKFLANTSTTGGIQYVEATVAPSNCTSRRMFEGFAQSCGAEFTIAPHFEASIFGARTHEAEHLLRIGPIAFRIES